MKKCGARQIVGCFTNLLLVASLCWLPSRVAGAESHWVTSWGCGLQLTEPANLPPAPGLANNTLRQVVHVTIGGKQLRAHFSNVYGTNAVVMNSVHVALSTGASAIDPTTDRPLTFKGAASTILPPGEAAWSDPLNFDLPPLTNLAITICFGETSGRATGHPGSRTRSFIQPGNAVAITNMPEAISTPHWYIIAGIDVMADRSSAAVVTLGDSITDGRGSTTDGNDRWPDALARRFSTNAATSRVAVVNMGIGGNGIFGGLGPSGIKRFDRDVIEPSGVHWLILFEGINDIGGSGSESVATNLINAYGQFIDKAHAAKLRVYGATITPFGGHSYYSPMHETARQTVNDWIRTSGRFDAVIDMDATVRNPVTLTNLLKAYDTGDHLHLNPTGYQAMADAIDLKLFAP
jgi:lysophospholipase L1-like esterase